MAAPLDEATLARLRALTGRTDSVLAPTYPYLAA